MRNSERKKFRENIKSDRDWRIYSRIGRTFLISERQTKIISISEKQKKVKNKTRK